MKAPRMKWNILSLFPALLCVVLIFYFSLQPGEVSDQTSINVTGSITNTFLGIEVSPEVFLLINNVIRILAHFAEYCMLAVAMAYASTRNGIRRHLRAVYMCGVCLFISLLDEFVQIFVPMRYGDPRDVVVDMAGVVITAAAVLKLRKTRALPRNEGRKGKRREFLNCEIDDVTFDEALDRIMGYAGGEHKCRMLVTPNADHVIKLEKDAEFREVYAHADLITTDGTPLLWIADSFNCPITERVTGADLLPAVCDRAAKEGRSMFFLAASNELLENAIPRLEQDYPGIKILGGYVPPMGFGEKKEEVDKAVAKINEAAPDILVVGVGAPRSEKFIYRNRQRLDVGVALPVGAALAFATGEQKRAPLWMRRLGLEWFYRFLQEPGRMFKRYFVDDMKIFFLALKYRDVVIRGYKGEDGN